MKKKQIQTNKNQKNIKKTFKQKKKQIKPII